MEPTEPASTPPPYPRRLARRLRIAAYTFAAGATALTLASTIHLPVYSIGPGPARNVAAMVKVTGRPTYTSAGRFLLTTVAVSDRPLTLLEGLAAWLDPSESVIRREAIVRPGLDEEQQTLLNVRDIEESKYAAEVVALRAAGLDVHRVAGARIISVIPDSPADDVLKQGDLVVEVDGRRIVDPEALSVAMRGRAVGAPVRLTVDRGKVRHRFTIKTVQSLFEDKPQPSVGIFVHDAFTIPVEVGIDTGDIGGPSGGLVFALALTDSLDPADLTKGHRIAATGTLDVEGRVGEIGGVKDKLQAARHVGADVFVLPTGELGEARPHAKGLRLIGVQTFEEAIAALRALPAARR